MNNSHHSIDYKLSAIKLYLKLKSIRKTCSYLDCSKSSLQRWLQKYFENQLFENKHYKHRKTLADTKILDFIRIELIKNSTITLAKLKNKIFNVWNKNISISYLFYIIKYKLKNTLKQLRKKYYPEKKLITYRKDKFKFYKKILRKGITKIISIDETAFYLNMTKNFGRCKIGKRCYKTTHKYPFVKFNFICAIKYGKVIGFKLY